MRTLVSLQDLSHDQWLQERKRGIGSSSAAAVLGISPWVSALELWTELVGLATDREESEAMEWGTTLEPVIANKYAKVTGRKLAKPTHIYQHEQYDWMIGNPDRFIEGNPRGLGVLEIKTTGAFHASDWDEEAPAMYQVQLQHLLAVTGAAWGSFAVLIGGQRFKWMDVERNDKFINYLIEREREFWQMVIDGIPPLPDESDSARRALSLLYPIETPEKVIELAEELRRHQQDLQSAKEMIRQAEDLKQRAENQIKAVMGDAVMGLFPDGTGFQWKLQHKDSYTVKASDFRVLREIKKAKGGKSL